MSDQEQDFDKGDAGSSFTVPIAWGQVKKGGYCMLKGHPCKVTDYSTAKPGKHGSAKATVVGLDIFTNKKYEDGGPTACNTYTPLVQKHEISLIDITPEGFATLLHDDGSLKEDLKLPADEPELSAQIRKYFDQGKDTLVTIISACGQEKIISVRTK